MTAASNTFSLATDQLDVADRAVAESHSVELLCRTVEALLSMMLAAYGFYRETEAMAFDMVDETERKVAFRTVRQHGPAFIALFVDVGSKLEGHLGRHQDQHIAFEEPFRLAIAYIREQHATLQQAAALRAEMAPWEAAADEVL